MEVKKAIATRHSVRKYKDKPVSRENIMGIIEAASRAPSGLNNQPWRFKILTDRKSLDLLSGYTKYSGVIKSAPAAVCVFLDTAASYDRDKDLMAVGACVQNMLLSAHSAGLAACWLGEILNKKESVTEFLKVPRTSELAAVITLGFSGERPNKTPRKKATDLLI
jgi:nitroreductase